MFYRFLLVQYPGKLLKVNLWEYIGEKIASVVCVPLASSASHFKVCLQPFWQAVSLKSSHERKLGTWLLSGKGCIGSRLEHLYSSVI